MNKKDFGKRFTALLEQLATVEATAHREDDGSVYVDNQALLNWKVKARNLLAQAVGPSSEHFQQFTEAEGVFYGTNHDILESLKAVFLAAKEDYEEGWISNEENAGKADMVQRFNPKSRKVFIVHGHDEAFKLSVARFLEQGGLQPIILHEQPNSGHTIVEKFESHTQDVSFAVALLTADDVGGQNATTLQPRARQNVVFEYGYLLGLLGRARVCAIVDPSVEKPSDIHGVVYISRAGEWKNELVKELITANVPFDLQKAFGGGT